MVKLSIPGWDKDKDRVYAAGDSFTPDFSGRPSRPRTAPPTPSTSLAPLFRLNSDANNRPEASPFITLKLSSPSFLDSVVHDDLSDNPLYAIETVDNITKIRRSDAKGFITTSRVRWTASSRPSSAMRRSREFDDPCISFGNGSWKPVDEFLTFSYGTLSMSRKFYIPHHPNSLRWKRVGAVYHCLTNDVKGPVAILEPAVSTTLSQLKVFNPMLRSRDTSRPQKMHGGVPISLLDFLLATAMLLVTEPNEWTNVTRPGPINEPDEDNEIRAGPSRFSRTSHGSSLSLSSLFNAQAPPEPQPLPPPVPNMPSVEQWRKTVPSLRATSPDALRSGSPSSPAQTSGGASHSSDSTDPLSTPASPGASNLFSFHSPSRQRFSSVPSLAGSSAPSRELPIPPGAGPTDRSTVAPQLRRLLVIHAHTKSVLLAHARRLLLRPALPPPHPHRRTQVDASQPCKAANGSNEQFDVLPHVVNGRQYHATSIKYPDTELGPRYEQPDREEEEWA
ncbi:hypothetical protein EWM64_g4329 [Hericium alpestre]|uniref:Uncharacterized protein n=1 Tax=Hericium alpestre TaxID=135208 RepID=A0A4Z0A1H9_9AGAM|nr:hypothetical protein EWM64_g4329 [Hericium alpestre]